MEPQGQRIREKTIIDRRGKMSEDSRAQEAAGLLPAERDEGEVLQKESLRKGGPWCPSKRE